MAAVAFDTREDALRYVAALLDYGANHLADRWSIVERVSTAEHVVIAPQDLPAALEAWRRGG